MNIWRKYYINSNFKALILLGAFVMLIGLFVISLRAGAVSIPFSRLWDIVTGGDFNNRLWQIFYFVRLPRALAAVLAGIALSVSGTVLQTVLNNPMCSPNIIGVNAGAGLFMIIVAAVFPGYAALAPAAAFIGALAAVIIVYFIAKKTGTSKLAIVLSGIAVSSILSALTDTIITLVPEAKVSRIDFLIGSFSGVTMPQVVFAFIYIALGIITVVLLSVDINVLSLGDSIAASLGLRVSFIRGLLLVAAALLAGSAISLGGLIGFVGLIVPHISKIIIGYDHKYLIPLSAIIGGIFCLGCDMLARVLFIPYELPVGIIMSLIGSVFFIYLILNRRRRAVID